MTTGRINQVAHQTPGEGRNQRRANDDGNDPTPSARTSPARTTRTHTHNTKSPKRTFCTGEHARGELATDSPTVLTRRPTPSKGADPRMLPVWKQENAADMQSRKPHTGAPFAHKLGTRAPTQVTRTTSLGAGLHSRRIPNAQ